MISKQLKLTQTAIAVTATFVAGASSAVFAQEADVTTETVKVTASRVEQELKDVNMSVSVITAEDIKHSSARNVGELLEDIPGVRINNDGGQGMKRVKIRGENAFRTLIMIDGQKVAEHKSMSGSPMLIDPSQIERIEVIKGPASVLYGSDAMGGVVNIITKKGGKKAVEGEVSAGLNTSASGKSASASIFGSYEGWNYRLSAGVEDNENLETPVGEMPNTYFSARTASAFLSYDINENFIVGGNLDYYDLEFGSGNYDSPDFAVDVPKWTRTKTALFGEMKNVTDTLVRLRTDAFYQRSEKEMVNTVVGKYDQKTIDWLKASGNQMMQMVGNMVQVGDPYKITPAADNKIDQYGFSIQSDWQLGESHYLVAGYEMSYDKLTADSVTSAKFTDRMPFRPISEKSFDGYQLTNALYASMESSLPADFTLNYGVRYTWVKTEMDVVDYTNKTAGSSPSYSDGKAVFNVGLLWNGNENLTLRANYAQGYRSPILQELYVDTAMGTGFSTTYANADLKPETSDNFEIGARWLSGPASLDVVAFYSESDDYIATLWNAALDGYQYDNVAKAKSFGVELSTSYRIGMTGFEPYATLTWMRRQYDNGEGFKTYDTATPAIMARYGVRWNGEYDGIGIRTDVYARSLSKTKYRSAAGTSDYELGGYTTLNITAGLSFGPEKQYSLDAGFYNIFDQAYREQQSIYEPGRYLAIKLNARF